MSERFYINCPLQPGPTTLDGPEAHHLAVVCRLRPGDQVTLFNGDGHEYPARLENVSRRQVDLSILERTSPLRELHLTVELAVSLPKGDRGQFLIEKLTELGVTTFVLLTCQHSVVHPREGRIDKLRRWVIEASKQCGRNVLMDIREPMPWQEYCVAGKEGVLSILAHPCKEGNPAKIVEMDKLIGAGPVRFAVGPEAGFTSEEVDLGLANGWQRVDLGPRILRIETAALVLAAWVHPLSRDAERSAQRRNHPPF